MSEMSKLRWRCRRGMKELDVLMNRYLDQRYEQASEEERAVFVDLIDVQDPDLYTWFIGRAEPDRDDFKKIVALILDLPH